MDFLRKLLGLPSVWIALALLLLHGILIFGRKDAEIVYGDSGLMYLQARQLLEANYSTFAFDYPGQDLDPEFEFVPYRKPFLAPVDGAYYIDFPPYFPLVAAPFLDALGYPGLYLPGFLGLAVTLFLLIGCSHLVGLGRIGRSTVLLLYGLVSTVTLYNYIFHEYPLALCLWAGALYCLLRLERHGFSPPLAAAFGFLCGLAVVFRMELALPSAAAGLAYLIVVRERFVSFGVYAVGGVALPIVFLLVANEYIHGHPLGLRYAMTISENTNPDSRWTIVYGLLFSEVRGMLRQSPFFLLILLAPFTRFERPGKLLLALVLTAFPAILILSPNHGDHIAARYMFGLFAPGCILAALVVRDFQMEEYRRALALFALILAVIGFRFQYKGYQWIVQSDRAARTVLERLDVVEARYLVFDGFGPPLNLQNRFSEKVFFVADTKEKRARISEKIANSKVFQWAIVGSLPPAEGERDPQEFYQDLADRGWILNWPRGMKWRPDRILLEPPLFVVQVNR